MRMIFSMYLYRYNVSEGPAAALNEYEESLSYKLFHFLIAILLIQ